MLIRLSDGKVMASWHPNWKEINNFISDKKFAPKGNNNTLRAMHPLLLDNGDLIFNTTNALVRLSLCGSETMWVIDKIFHHSVEFALDKNSVWVPSVSNSYFAANKWLNHNLRDDSVARVSFDGNILENISLSQVLIENGLRELLLGTADDKFKSDPIHLNQVSVATTSGKYWKRGDLLLSLRHLSLILIYRPSMGKVIWHKLGPWMNQHSARFVGNHKISVFDNNVIGGYQPNHEFVADGDTNRVIVYDFNKNRYEEPFAELLSRAKPVTHAEGVAQILPDGGLFLEETLYGRHLRFSKSEIIWSRINDFDKDTIGMVSWSRYLTENEARIPLKSIQTRCVSTKCCQNE